MSLPQVADLRYGLTGRGRDIVLRTMGGLYVDVGVSFPPSPYPPHCPSDSLFSPLYGYDTFWIQQSGGVDELHPVV